MPLKADQRVQDFKASILSGRFLNSTELLQKAQESSGIADAAGGEEWRTKGVESTAARLKTKSRLKE